MNQDKLPESNQPPSVVIMIEKGTVTSIFSNAPVNAIILDYDVEGVPDEEKVIVPFDYEPNEEEVQTTILSIDVIEDKPFVDRVQKLY